LSKQTVGKVETVKIMGNPSEAAMLRYVVEMTDAQHLRAQYEIVYEVCGVLCSCGSCAGAIQLNTQISFGDREGYARKK
jgi:hypothetical protein